MKNLAKVCHISYGASLIQWVDDYDFLNHNPYVEDAYRIFVESDLIFQKNTKYISIGYLKLDDYQFYNRPHVEFEKFTIAWKPRWTAGFDSSLSRYIDDFINFANKGFLINFICHPFLLSAIKRNSDSVALIDKITLFQSMDNVNTVDGEDFLDYVLGSDIFVCDISSTMAEFMSTGKSIILTNANLKLNSAGEKIVNEIVTLNKDEDISSMVEEAIREDCSLIEKRKKVFNEIFNVEKNISSSCKLRNFLINDYVAF